MLAAFRGDVLSGADRCGVLWFALPVLLVSARGGRLAIGVSGLPVETGSRRVLGGSNWLLELRCGRMGGPTKTPQVWVPAASPTRIPRTIRHYAAHGGTAANVASLAFDKPLCR